MGIALLPAIVLGLSMIILVFCLLFLSVLVILIDHDYKIRKKYLITIDEQAHDKGKNFIVVYLIFCDRLCVKASHY